MAGVRPMNQGKRGSERARRGAARAERERETLRASRYAQRLEREGRVSPGQTATPAAAAATVSMYEAEVVLGLEEFARAELRALFRGRPPARGGAQPGTLLFPYRGDARRLTSLGTVTSVSRVYPFEVPRPRALLGEEHLQTLLKQIRSVVDLHPPGTFKSFRFSAAGVTSSIFARLSEALESRTGLPADPEDGDLLIRVRRAVTSSGGPGPAPPASEKGFEILVRLTPRPLAARPWRVCNLPGALNATVARAMAGLTAPSPHDRFINLTCGSGTLMIERLALGPARLILGGDRDPEALRCARANLAAAGCDRRATLVRWDAGRLPLRNGSANVLCADLPYGMLMGSRRENERLYPELLVEATRVAAAGAAMVLITHAVPLLDQALARLPAHWTVERRFEVQIPFKSGILRPRVLLLRRTGRRFQA
jgi:tRNA (guanine6-N2)-methyltransferase